MVETVHALAPIDQIKLVVAKIISVEKHPHADKLYEKKVYDGEKIKTIV